MNNNNKKPTLGRGIGSLLGNNPTNSFAGVVNQNTMNSMPEFNREAAVVAKSDDTNNIFMVDISQVKANPNQPRKIFKEKDLEELSLSIKENGIIQPILVTKVQGGFEVIAGERRLRAAKKAGLEKVPVIVRTATDRDKMILAVIENVQRSDLNCVEEAVAYYQLMSDFKVTQEELAKKIGKERSTVANFLRILKLPRPVLDLLQKEILSFGHAKVLVSIEDKETVIRLANLAVTNQWSVRELEDATKGRDKKPKENINKFFNEKLDVCRQTLEKKTGFHFDIASKKNGKGEITIKFNNEAEFNDVYEFLLK
jgi:ParB family chromosome partitioning protein